MQEDGNKKGNFIKIECAFLRQNFVNTMKEMQIKVM